MAFVTVIVIADLYYYGMWIEEILREKDKDLNHVGRTSDKK